MSEHALERVELTNMCAIIDEKSQKVVVQERIKSWCGLTFPGGHVKPGEAIVPSTIREIREETGLEIRKLRACGVKDWYDSEKKARYLVFLFATTEFSGKLLTETDEGKVYWLDIAQLKNREDLASGFIEMAEMMLQQKYAEFSYDINGEDWKKVFY